MLKNMVQSNEMLFNLQYITNKSCIIIIYVHFFTPFSIGSMEFDLILINSLVWDSIISLKVSKYPQVIVDDNIISELSRDDGIG